MFVLLCYANVLIWFSSRVKPYFVTAAEKEHKLSAQLLELIHDQDDNSYHP